MSDNNCNTIRNKMEESALRDDYGQLVQVHLNQCESCRRFEKEQRNLRELVGSLGTVQAPSDFDFKLRARMADRSSGRTGRHWSLTPLFATAASIVLFVGVIAGIGYVNKRPPTNSSIAIQTPSQSPVQSPVQTVQTAQTAQTAGSTGASSLNQNSNDETVQKASIPKRNGGQLTQATYKPKRSIVASDFSSTGAQTFGSTTQFNASRVFPIDASLNSLKVSLDDGRGNARTISLPGVSFGSQRVLATGNQPQQKGLW